MAKPAVFLDRDGTLLEEAGYLDRLERLVFFPYSVDAVRLLNRAGFAVIIITNQAGIARGIFKEAFVADAHRHVAARLARMELLTPGDFANVTRRVQGLQLELDPGGWVDELQAEHDTKP